MQLPLEIKIICTIKCSDSFICCCRRYTGVFEFVYHVVDIQTFFIRTRYQAALPLSTLYETTHNQVDHADHCRQVGRRASTWHCVKW